MREERLLQLFCGVEETGLCVQYHLIDKWRAQSVSRRTAELDQDLNEHQLSVYQDCQARKEGLWHRSSDCVDEAGLVDAEAKWLNRDALAQQAKDLVSGEGLGAEAREAAAEVGGELLSCPERHLAASQQQVDAHVAALSGSTTAGRYSTKAEGAGMTKQDAEQRGTDLQERVGASEKETAGK
eukprot:6205019-Pleurochrysis_carterae.AAC.2